MNGRTLAVLFVCLAGVVGDVAAQNAARKGSVAGAQIGGEPHRIVVAPNAAPDCLILLEGAPETPFALFLGTDPRRSTLVAAGVIGDAGVAALTFPVPRSVLEFSTLLLSPHPNGIGVVGFATRRDGTSRAVPNVRTAVTPPTLSSVGSNAAFAVGHYWSWSEAALARPSLETDSTEPESSAVECRSRFEARPSPGASCGSFPTVNEIGVQPPFFPCINSVTPGACRTEVQRALIAQPYPVRFLTADCIWDYGNGAVLGVEIVSLVPCVSDRPRDSRPDRRVGVSR